MSTTASSAESFIDNCTAHFGVIPHEEFPRALKYVDIHATHPDHGRVGSLRALKISRKPIGGEFLMVMDSDSQELSEFATTLFDRMGHLKPEFTEHEYQKGAGVWGRELDEGLLLYVLSVNVPQVRTRYYMIQVLANICYSELQTEGCGLISPAKARALRARPSWLFLDRVAGPRT